MGLLVSGNITTADGFTLPSIYVSLTSFNFRSSANMPTFASTSSLINAQFNCYKSRDTTELILESGQVDGNLYIYNSQGVSRPTS